MDIFTDGSADNLTKTNGGIGVYFYDEKYQMYNISRKSKIKEPTNQKMELLAIISAIKTCKKNKLEGKINIYTDSKYSIDIITKYVHIWKNNKWMRKVGNKNKPICNLNLVKEFYRLNNNSTVEYIHVRGHKKEPEDKNSIEWKKWYGNKMADKLAKIGGKNKCI